MKKYIIMTYEISRIGGTQTYTAAKTKWLEQQGWDVSILCNRQDKEKYSIPYLSKFHKGSIWWLETLPENFSRLDCQLIVRYMGSLCGINSNTYDEIIIESHYTEVHLWGELLAQKYHAKSFCVALNEVYRGPGKYYEYYFNFYDFKLDRQELGGYTDNLNRLFDGHRVIQPEEENIFDISESPFEDVQNKEIDSIELMDYNICFISRMEKPYACTVIKEIAQFANNHSEKSVQLILIGDTRCIDSFLSSLDPIQNLSTVKLGVLSPIPRSILTKADVFVGGSGCAWYPADEGALTISIDAETGKAIGIVGYDTINVIHAGQDDRILPLSLVLERALVEKGYLRKQYFFPTTDYDESCLQNMQTIHSSEKTKHYYPMQRICTGYVKNKYRHYISLNLFLFYPHLYISLRNLLHLD